MAAKKSPKLLLVELYEAGVQMRVDENGHLRASHVDGTLTQEEIDIIKANKEAFKELLVFDEETVRKLMRQMLKVVYERLGEEVSLTTLNYVDTRTLEWEERINEGFHERNMFKVRRACRRYVEEAIQAIKEIRKIDEMVPA